MVWRITEADIEIELVPGLLIHVNHAGSFRTRESESYPITSSLRRLPRRCGNIYVSVKPHWEHRSNSANLPQARNATGLRCLNYLCVFLHIHVSFGV